MTQFYKQYKAIEPYLQSSNPPADGKEHLQSREDRRKLDGMYEVRHVALELVWLLGHITDSFSHSVHLVRLLLDFLPVLLVRADLPETTAESVLTSPCSQVERNSGRNGELPRPGRADAGVPVDRRFSRH